VKIGLILALLVPAIGARAETVAPPVISPPDSWVQRQSGTVRVLNKIDSTVQTLSLQVGQTIQVKSLSITLLACAVRPDDLPRDATARLSVSDSNAGVAGFQGWILQNEPAANVVENPVFDIQLASCG
jgi:hypothetical protein